MPAMLAWQLSCLDDACQGGKMATQLNDFFFSYLISRFCFLPCQVNIMKIIIVKWCSDVECNRPMCALGIALT